MTAALGTLPFLGTLWLLVVMGAAILEESGAKIAAALKGRLPHQPSPALLRFRTRGPRRAVIRRAQTWRAAA
jgi:hypothetical protein